MNIRKKLEFFIDKYYLILIVFVATIVTYLNYYGHIMLVIYPYYVDFKNVILSGFDPDAAKLCNPTFPMWGYGWLLILTENKILLIIIQFAFAIFSVWLLFRFLDNNEIFSYHTLLILKIIILIAIPWYAFHSIRWPYSISASLSTISIIIFTEQFFYKTIKSISLKHIIQSGLIFGLALNFRSDYYLLPFALFGTILLFVKPFGKHWSKGLFWLTSVYILILPWSLYTKQVTGHFLITSTNAGHVFFVGLGDLPNNKWGIQPVDNDSTLHTLIRDKFGEPKSTLTYESNEFLKDEFKRRIKNDPGEYFRKCLYTIKKLPFAGVYSGEFYEEEYLKIQKTDEYWILPGQNWKYEPEYDKFLTERRNSTGLIKKILSNFSIRILFEHFSLYFGKLLVFFSYLFIPLTFCFSLKTKNIFILIILGFIIFQMLINVIAFNYRCYISNVFLLHIINFTFGLYLLKNLVISLFNTLR